MRRGGRGHALWPVFASLTLLTSPLVGQTLNPDLIRVQCLTIHQIENQSILFGMVIDGRSGTPIPGGTVSLRWLTTSGIADTVVHSTSVETPNGAFIFCDVPQDTRIEAWASALGRLTRREEFYFTGSESMRRDLEIGLRSILATLSGELTDATTGAPVADATVSIEGAGVSALTNGAGHFRLPDIPVGHHELKIQHLVYGQPTLDVTVEAGQSTHLVATLDPRPIALEPISVRISTRPQWLETTGFYDRREKSLGQFVTPKDIERRRYARFSEVLRDVQGIDVTTVCTPRCIQRVRMSATTLPGCIPTFYVDGRRLFVRPAPTTAPNQPPGLLELDALATGSDLAAVEVYRSLAEMPAQFFGRCGSIVIWTKRGAG